MNQKFSYKRIPVIQVEAIIHSQNREKHFKIDSNITLTYINIILNITKECMLMVFALQSKRTH